MSFNVDEWREAHAPWSFTADGVTHVARPVSARALGPLLERLRNTTGEVAQGKVLMKILRLAYPWKPSYQWRGGDPVQALLDLEPRLRKELLTDFFGSLGVGRQSAPPLETGGTSSPPSTAIPTPAV